MCGICGYMHLDDRQRPSQEVLAAMTATLAHRGPDDAGYYLNGSIGLGHRRLSIIDLETGDQPMFNEDRTKVIVQNGEIYNFTTLRDELTNRSHRFSTKSDTEVIIHAYEEFGELCLERLDGMFSFALWDGATQRLFLARDRFGKKPLYYGVFDNIFIFASELKALLAHPATKRVIDLGALSAYLAYDYVPSPGTIFKGVYRLEAGHSLTVSRRSGVVKKQYWDITFDIKESWRSDVAGCTERLTGLLREATRKRLASDVPLGVFLSGGIDSSSVVAMMSEHLDGGRIKTFSIAFDEAAYDESRSAESVAKFFHTDHHQELVRPALMLEELPRILDILDEPFADSSIIPTYLISQFTRRSVTVALGGDGADELFMGYPSFVAHALSLYVDRFPSQIHAVLGAFASFVPGGSNSLSAGFRMRRFIRGLPYRDAIRHQTWIGTFSPSAQAALIAPIAGEISLDPQDVYARSIAHMERVRHLSLLDRIAYLYMKTYLTDDILAKVDRASMAHGLEVRAPFLDTAFSEFVQTIPAALKLKGFSGKFILKRAMKNLLPAETILKKKHGFAVPVSAWFRGELRGLLLETFRKERIAKDGIFDPGHIDTLIRQHLASERDNGREIWSLLIFQLWYNKWVKRT